MPPSVTSAVASKKSPLMLIVPSLTKSGTFVPFTPHVMPIGLPFAPEKFNVPRFVSLELASLWLISHVTMPELPFPIVEVSCSVTPDSIVKLAEPPTTGTTLIALLSPPIVIDPVPLIVALPSAQ